MNYRYETALKYMPYAQAHIEHDGDRLILWSYYTRVATFNTSTGEIEEVTGLYSTTTRRHIFAFAKEVGLTYQDFRTFYEKA